MSSQESKYDDILNRTYPFELIRPRMTGMDRAAQFSPFAALTGYEEAVKETARTTEGKVELEEHAKELLDEKLLFLNGYEGEKPLVSITHFIPDLHKSGGTYEKVCGRIRKIDLIGRLCILEDGQLISIENIYEIDSDIFDKQW